MKTKKLTDSQRVILHDMQVGNTLLLSKKMYDYGKYSIIRNGVKKPVNSNSVEALIRSGRIQVDQVSNLEVTFKIASTTIVL